MSPEIECEAMIAELGAADVRTRDVAAEALGDVIEQYRLPTQDLARVVNALVTAFCSEQSDTVIESILNALCYAVDRNPPISVPTEAIARRRSELKGSAVEHADYILEACGERR